MRKDKIEIPQVLAAYMDLSNWDKENNKYKGNWIFTLQDVDRTDTVFGGRVEEAANGVHGRVSDGLAKEVIQADAGIGFKWIRDKEIFTREERPLTEAEQVMLFEAVCSQLFWGTQLNEGEKKRYEDFLKLYLH